MSFLARKRVVIPVALVALGVAGFKGYGAYTRSNPVDYSRGGGDFAALPSATATSAPRTPTARAAASGGATATATARPPAVLPRTDATSAQTQAPAVPAGPTGQALSLPRPGTYSLSVQGSEKVQFGPVSFCNQKLPAATALVIKRASGEGPASYDFDVPFFPGKTGQHDERHIYRYTPDAVLLDYEIATVTCQGVRQSSETSYKPEQPRVQLPLAVGKSWRYQGGGADRTEDATTKVLRTETLLLAGQRVLTYVLHSTTTFTGSESGTRDQTWWYAPTWAMPVKWHDKQSGHRSGASYSGDITATITSRP